MGGMFESTPVDRPAVEAAVREHWGLDLGDVLRASQNHTFSATHPATGARFAVRVVPDPDGAHHARVATEADVVAWLAGAGGLAGACAPVPPTTASAGAAAAASAAVRAGPYTIVVLPWAPGAMVDYVGLRWATDEGVVRACGAWLARLHAASRELSAAHPALAARVRRWDATFGGLMAGAPLHPDDAAEQAAAAAAPSGTTARFVVLHGDFNVGNFHAVEEGEGGRPQLHVFDWDQLVRGWPELDLAYAGAMVAMLAEGGMPLGGDPVPGADTAAYLRSLVGGYESVAGPGAIDGARLARMLQLRKAFYARFTAAAVADPATPDAVRAAMGYNAAWLAKAPPQTDGWV